MRWKCKIDNDGYMTISGVDSSKMRVLGFGKGYLLVKCSGSSYQSGSDTKYSPSAIHTYLIENLEHKADGTFTFETHDLHGVVEGHPQADKAWVEAHRKLLSATSKEQ